MKHSSFRPAVPKPPSGTAALLASAKQSFLPQSALPTRSVHAVMFETDRALSLIHLNYCYNFSTLC